MRYLLLSDVHGNIDAFETVLEHAEGSWDRAIVLGDLVDYGAEPNLVIDKVRALDPLSVTRRRAGSTTGVSSIRWRDWRPPGPGSS